MKRIVKILAVDDEKFNLLLLQTCLKGDKYQLNTCDNATEALEQFKKLDFDIILLDIMMVGIDGFEIRKLVREINKKIPIIFLTSMVDDINSTMLSRIAADQYSYYMHKSFNKASLTAKIDDAVAIYDEHRNTDIYYHKIEEDLALAGDVQQIMLPKWCGSVGEMIAAYIYLPAMQVSGDMLSFLQLDNDRLMFFIGDIAGHGVQAALYMSAMHSFLKYMFQGGSGPVEPHAALNKLQAFFQSNLGCKNYMTCLVAIFDFKKNHLSFQSAGHPGMIVCPKSTGVAAQIDMGDRGGLPIGLVRDTVYSADDTVEYDFSDDDVFVAYTDGIMDVCNAANEMAGEETFMTLLGPLTKESEAPAIPYRMFNALSLIGYNSTPDDICLVVIQKKNVSRNAVQYIINPDPQEAGGCAAAVADFLCKNSFSDVVSAKAELLLNEFLNNVIIHGQEKNKHTQGNIYISAAVDGKDIHLRVLDRGKSWSDSDEQLDSPEEYFDRQNDAKATSGRGIAIIHSIANAITRNNYSGLNETHFIIDSVLADNEDEMKL